ncbi:E2/UBC family protein [Methylomonas sp. OY6]|uniref:E2/UBC family protein n=1 Tax=Methylomonas defluvii TaxID=3045149 RepID=A0ABU4UHB2_9GAMM|nr:E2/UBC family protein [Methylomonas sp. OY6]MDX8128114.1 E2/UBC family protein [Methylomonas sp. OY6]
MSVLPLKCRRYLTERGITYVEIEDGPQKGVILHNFQLPPGQFDAVAASILILLPAGYPDNPPDMFYALPWLRLVTSNGYPKAADCPIMFSGQSWQRWSRHNNAWRPGVDGIWTMIKRIETALQEAA